MITHRPVQANIDSMFGSQAKQTPQEITFLLIPGFSMIGFAAMVDPLRWANTISEQPLYTWQIVSIHGGAVESSDGISLLADCPIEQAECPDTLIVCAGYSVQRQGSKKLFAALRRMAAQGVDIGGQDTGSYLLAAAGLLDGYRATIHWENCDSYREAFRQVTVSQELFEIDRGRFSCSGGLSGLDMMLYLIQQQHGSELSMAISEQLIYHQVREGHQHQRMSLRARYGVSNPKLLETLAIMQREVENPTPIPKLAEQAHISERELERLFRKYFSSTPIAFYRSLRLEKARLFLQQTSYSITQVAVLCGFASVSHFSRCYRRQYGYPPREERKREPLLGRI